MNSATLRMKWSRRSVVMLGAASAVTVLAGCDRSSPEADRKPRIRLGAYEWPGSYWIDVAVQKGWFAAAGLNVERIETEGRYFESLDAVVAGKIDAMGFSQFDLVRYAAAGHDLVGVVAVDYSDGAEALVAQPGIQTLQELAGKRVALHRGTYLEYLLSVAAERASLDVRTLSLVDRAEEAAIADLKAGRVDAVFLWEPYASRAEAAARGNRLFSTAEFPGLTYTVLSLPRAFVTAHPREVESLVRVWERTTQFILDHPDEACAIIAKVYHLAPGAPRELMLTDHILGNEENTRAFSYAAGFESLHGSWRRMNDFMLDHGMTKRQVSSADHIDSRFLAAAARDNDL